MDLLQGNIKPIYLKYLFMAFGSCIIVSIYSFVDTIVVGQFEGPVGTAALATVTPFWAIIMGLGLLFGVGGGVLMSKAKGENNPVQAAQSFTIAFILALLATLVLWILFIFFADNILILFGADEILLSYAKQYIYWFKFSIPVFTMGQFLIVFIRNDNTPGLTTFAVLIGGICNTIGDWFFVFPCKMGISGAGLATMIGQIVCFLILCSYFLRTKCSLRFTRPIAFWKKAKSIVFIGLSTFIVCLSAGIIVILFNRQVMRYSNAVTLAVYGVICTISTLLQCISEGIGQASQPLFSVNYGAKQFDRIRKTLRYAIITAAIYGTIATALLLTFPTPIICIFMAATPDVLAIAPQAMHAYFLCLLLMPFNILCTYYFQAILQHRVSFIISITRGIVISGLLIFTLPLCFGFNSIWYTMPLTELVVASYSALSIRKSLRKT